MVFRIISFINPKLMLTQVLGRLGTIAPPPIHKTLNAQNRLHP